MHVLNKKENYLYLLIATFVNLVIVVKLGIQPKTAVAELGIFSMLFIFNLLFFYSIIENLNWGAYLGFLIFTIGLANTILIYFFVLSYWLILLAAANLFGMILCAKEINQSAGIRKRYENYRKYSFLDDDFTYNGREKKQENGKLKEVIPYHEEFHDLPQFDDEDNKLSKDYPHISELKDLKKKKEAKTEFKAKSEEYPDDSGEFIEINKDFLELEDEIKKIHGRTQKKVPAGKKSLQASRVGKKEKKEGGKTKMKWKNPEPGEAKAGKSGKTRKKNAPSELDELEHELEDIQKHKGEHIEFRKR